MSNKNEEKPMRKEGKPSNASMYAFITMILTAIGLIYAIYSNHSASLVAEYTVSSYERDPMVNSILNRTILVANNLLSDKYDSVKESKDLLNKYHLKGSEYDLSILLDKFQFKILSDLPESIRSSYMMDSPRARYVVNVENMGNDKAEDVRLKLPYVTYAEIRREGKKVVNKKIEGGVIFLGDLEPNENVRLVGWSTSSGSMFEEVQLSYAKGLGEVIKPPVRVAPFFVFLNKWWGTILWLFLSLSSLITLSVISHKNTNRQASASDDE